MVNGKKKYFLNRKTGEVVFMKNRRKAYKYFKADGKVVGYEVSKADVLDRAQTAEFLLSTVEEYCVIVCGENETADGIA